MNSIIREQKQNAAGIKEEFEIVTDKQLEFEKRFENCYLFVQISSHCIESSEQQRNFI